MVVFGGQMRLQLNMANSQVMQGSQGYPLMCQLRPVWYRNGLAGTGSWGVKQWYWACRPPWDARLRSWVHQSSVHVGIALLRPRVCAGCAGAEVRTGGGRWSEMAMHVSMECMYYSLGLAAGVEKVSD